MTDSPHGPENWGDLWATADGAAQVEYFYRPELIRILGRMDGLSEEEIEAQVAAERPTTREVLLDDILHCVNGGLSEEDKKAFVASWYAVPPMSAHRFLASLRSGGRAA